MISSRWPRPMGNMESIARMPVWSLSLIHIFHSMAHGLSALYDTPHGVACAIQMCIRDRQDTVRGFAAIVDGEADDLPESAFFNVGTLEDARQKAAEKLAEEKGGAV